MNRPLCFILMPFGKKINAEGAVVDFDSVYRETIAPAIEEAGLQPLRADEEAEGKILHKPMFERLILCEFAVADLTTANANVFYELGIRHAARPWSTVLVFAEGGTRLPFDPTPLQAVPYRLTDRGTPAKPEEFGKIVSQRLKEAKHAAMDSPVHELLEGFTEVGHTKTDVFRDRVDYSNEIKERLAAARKKGVEALRAIEEDLGDLEDVESGIIIDLLLSYRSVKAWKNMIQLVEKMPAPLAKTVLVREQCALALNRLGQGEQAEQLLLELIDERGPGSETLAILGRVYKDRWEKALEKGNTFVARGLLEKAIDAYLQGFETDWRDAHPGINAVTLMELREPPDPRREELIPVVSYAVDRRIASGRPDYWDYATRVELAVLAKDREKAMEALEQALNSIREVWEPETTLRNLRMIRRAREQREESVPWAEEIEQALEERTEK